jgi:colanic acid/amylovoran biosynthesis glycosyltransferase
MTLRIAVFVHEFPALSETFVLNQVTGLLDLGADVRLFASTAREESLEHADIMRYGLKRRVRYVGMPRSRLRRFAVGIRLLADGLRNRPKQTIRSLNVFRYGRAAVSLELLFATALLAGSERRYDVVYCHFGIVGRKVAFLQEIGAIEGTLVTTFHGVDVSQVLSQRPRLYRHLFRHGALFLPISRHWRDRLIDHGCDPNRIEVHHMGVDLSRFPFQPRRDLGRDGAIRILVIGRLVEKKGIEYGLRALAVAREHGMRFTCTVIGDGVLRGTLEALTDQLGLNTSVVFAGWRDQDEVASLMCNHQVLLAPSVTDSKGDQEGIPVTLMEAMATGMPVVSTRHSGIPELVTDDSSGLLVDERDVEALAAALLRLYGDADLRETLGRNARKAVAEGFDLRALNTRLQAIFEGLVSDEPRHGHSLVRQRERSDNGGIGGVTVRRSAGE